jgi:hypothetical protein
MLRRSIALPLLAVAVACSQAAPLDPKAIFVYSGGKMSPVAQITDKGIVSIGPEPDAGNETDRWLAPWFAPGGSYHYLGNDARRGTGTVIGPDPSIGEQGCGSVSADINIDVESPGDGLLTNYPLSDVGRPPIAEASPRQVRIMQRIATGVMLQRGVPPDVIRKMATVVSRTTAAPSVVIIPAHGRTPATMVASYIWDGVTDTEGAPFNSYTLTLIAEAGKARRYRPTHVLFQHATAESETSSYAFLTAADLDGDGKDELILVGSGYEWWWFEAFGKRGAKWRSLASGGGGGC